MKCKKCRKVIPDGSKYCNWCGVEQAKKSMYKRPDGLYEKSVMYHGKRVVFRGKSKKEIEKKMLEYNAEQQRGLPFNRVADLWEVEHYQGLAFNTVKGYKPAVAMAVEYFGTKPIKQIETLDIKRYIATFPSTWAQKTYKNHILVINLIFKFAVLSGFTDKNPCEYITPPKGLKSGHRRTLTEQEIEIIKNNTDKPFGLFALFLLYTGCRRGEALAVQWKDIDFKNKLIHITKSVYHDGNTPKIKTPKTESGNRNIILLDVLSSELRKIKGKKANDYLFDDNGKLYSNSRARDAWWNYRDEVGLSDVTPHMVRHGYATILHEAGIDPKDAQAMLGHANIQTTLDVYTHITEKQLAVTADRLNTYVNGA